MEIEVPGIGDAAGKNQLYEIRLDDQTGGQYYPQYSVHRLFPMKRPLHQYCRVRLLTDRFAGKGVGKGSLGYIIEIYSDGACEVEFSNEEGITYAQIVANPEELDRSEPADLDDGSAVPS